MYYNINALSDDERPPENVINNDALLDGFMKKRDFDRHKAEIKAEHGVQKGHSHSSERYD
jgi:hypothetical protein